MRLRALDSFYYSGDRKRGDIFDTESDVHANMLVMNGKAEIVVQTEDKPKRREYRRRDMRADE